MVSAAGIPGSEPLGSLSAADWASLSRIWKVPSPLASSASRSPGLTTARCAARESDATAHGTGKAAGSWQSARACCVQQLLRPASRASACFQQSLHPQ